MRRPGDLGVLMLCPGDVRSGHCENIRKRHDGAEVQECSNKSQNNGTVFFLCLCLNRVHFFHADLDFMG